MILDLVQTTKTLGQGDTLTVILLVFTMMVLVIQETVFFYVGVSVELKTLLHRTVLINQPLYQLTVILFRLANLVERWQIYDVSFAQNSSAQIICTGQITPVQAQVARTQSQKALLQSAGETNSVHRTISLP